MNRIRVLLADDHETVRHGLKLLIDAEDDMEVVGEAGDGKAAVERARALNPDVVVVDVSMPVMSGVIATRALSGAHPKMAIVALTRYSDQAYVQTLLAGGASAYVLKQSPSIELIRAIRTAAAGDQYLDQALVSRVAGDYLTRHSKARKPLITERESDVLKLMAQGYSNKEMSAELAVSVKTIEVHKANAMRKLNLRGRIDIVRFAILQGWLEEA